MYSQDTIPFISNERAFHLFWRLHQNRELGKTNKHVLCIMRRKKNITQGKFSLDGKIWLKLDVLFLLITQTKTLNSDETLLYLKLYLLESSKVYGNHFIGGLGWLFGRTAYSKNTKAVICEGHCKIAKNLGKKKKQILPHGTEATEK